jgi:Na+-driven multidrug efflux pump
MVGRISAFAVAAVGLGLQSLMLIFAVLTLLHVGTSVLLSRFMGASKIKQASLGLSSLLRFALLLSIPMTVLWYFLTPMLYIWFGTELEVVELGSSYVRILTLMMPFIFIKLVFETSFSAAKNTTTPFYMHIDHPFEQPDHSHSNTLK